VELTGSAFEVVAAVDSVSGWGRGAVHQVRLSALRAGDSPRREGVDLGHARVLAQIESRLPPILVHRRSMRVIDGMHRVRAAELAGRETIEAVFFDGDEHAAFVLAVRENIAHGLPLSLADRKAAAARMIDARPEMSDRSIARAAGLSGKTVGAIRVRSGNARALSAVTVGRDGRVRPINPEAGRRRARELIEAHPTASLRQIARQAGVSAGTVGAVRRQMREGVSSQVGSVGSSARRGLVGAGGADRSGSRSLDSAGSPAVTETAAGPAAAKSTLEILRSDPALRFSQTGRQLLRWLDARTIDGQQLNNLIDTIPPHCLPLIAKLAHDNAEAWHKVELQLHGHPPTK
jgi:ParB-like chromosome segregation protein Spo0J